MANRRVQSEPDNARWRAYLNGELTLEDMDDEELARMSFRAADGTFRGRPPKTVPRTFAQDVSRELLRRGSELHRRLYLEAIKTQGQVMATGEKDADKLRAANQIIERVAGKVPERLVLSDTRPDWQDLVDAMLTSPEEEAIERARDILGRR